MGKRALALPEPPGTDLGAPNHTGSGIQPVDKSRPMAYMMAIEFEWDDDKSHACLVRRGFDFAYAVRVFFDPHRIVVQDRRWEYVKERYRALGMIEERAYVAV